MEMWKRLYFLTFAKDYQPHGHVDKDPRKTEKLDQVVHKQKDSFLADKPWKKKQKIINPTDTKRQLFILGMCPPLCINVVSKMLKQEQTMPFFLNKGRNNF